MPLCEQEKQLALYLRYQTTHDRAFERCVKELRTLRKEREKVKIGFEWSMAGTPQLGMKSDERRLVS